MAQTGCYITMIPGISQSSCHPRTEWVVDSKSKSWIKISRELVVRMRKSYICGRLVGVSATVGWRRHDTYCLLRARTRGEAPTCVRDIMMWEWYHDVGVISWHDVSVIQWCVRDIMMWEYWEWYHDMWVISWYDGDIMMWELYHDVWVLMLGWGWGPLISDIATTKTRPGTRPGVEQQTAAAGTQLRSGSALVLFHCTATLLHCTMGNQGEHRQIKLSDWLFIKVR